MSDPGGSTSQRRPERSKGQVYDRAMRHVLEGDLEAFCSWLGVGPPGEVLSGSFPSGTLHADLLADLPGDRMLHVEYMRKAESDLAVRMLGYRARIMQRYPGRRVTQVLLILGEGRVISCDDPVTGFFLGLRVIYLREHPAEPLLAQPALAPLAVLTRGDERETLARTLRAIHTQVPAGPERDHLFEATFNLATIRMDGPTIERIWREISMTVDDLADFWRDTEVGRMVTAEGIEQGYVSALVDVLRERFGAGDPDEITSLARVLVSRAGGAAAMHAALAASSLDRLRAEADASSD